MRALISAFSCPVSFSARNFCSNSSSRKCPTFSSTVTVSAFSLVLSELDQFLEELIDIGEVEVAGEGEGGCAIVLTEEG